MLQNITECYRFRWCSRFGQHFGAWSYSLITSWDYPGRSGEWKLDKARAWQKSDLPWHLVFADSKYSNHLANPLPILDVLMFILEQKSTCFLMRRLLYNPAFAYACNVSMHIYIYILDVYWMNIMRYFVYNYIYMYICVCTYWIIVLILDVPHYIL